MLLERGIVTEISADFLKVTCRSKIDCLRCAQGKGCGGGILARWLGDRQYSIKAHYDPITQFPNINDFVVIALPANRIVKLAAIMYALPLCFMLICLSLQVVFLPNLSELLVIAIAIIALLSGFRIAKYLIKNAKDNTQMLPSLITDKSLIQTQESSCDNKAKLI